MSWGISPYLAGISAPLSYLTDISSFQETKSILRHNKLIIKCDVLQSTCAEEGGAYTANAESGDPPDDCLYAELISNGYTWSVLSNVDGNYWGFMS